MQHKYNYICIEKTTQYLKTLDALTYIYDILVYRDSTDIRGMSKIAMLTSLCREKESIHTVEVGSTTSPVQNIIYPYSVCLIAFCSHR